MRPAPGVPVCVDCEARLRIPVCLDYASRGTCGVCGGAEVTSFVAVVGPVREVEARRPEAPNPICICAKLEKLVAVLDRFKSRHNAVAFLMLGPGCPLHGLVQAVRP